MTAQTLTSQGRPLISSCQIARSFFSRFLGLMGKRKLSDHEGILFPHCNSIHTFFMRFPIDVVRVDAQGIVVGVETAVRPWRLLLPKRGTRHIIELRAQRCSELGIRFGTRLECKGVWP